MRQKSICCDNLSNDTCVQTKVSGRHARDICKVVEEEEEKNKRNTVP